MSALDKALPPKILELITSFTLRKVFFVIYKAITSALPHKPDQESGVAK